MIGLTPSRDNLRSAYVFAEGQVAEREDVDEMEREFKRGIAAIEREAAARALEAEADLVKGLRGRIMRARAAEIRKQEN